MTKWWFRLLMILFFVILIISIPTIWLSEVKDVYNNCIQYYGDVISEYPDAYSQCNSNARKAWTYPGILSEALITPIFFFYLTQLIFFKVIINFVALGGKK